MKDLIKYDEIDEAWKKQYLEKHPKMEQKCSKGGEAHYLTTENPDKFKESAQLFLHEDVEVENITLG